MKKYKNVVIAQKIIIKQVKYNSPHVQCSWRWVVNQIFSKIPKIVNLV